MARREDAERRARAIEELVYKLETAADAGLRATARELVQALMDLHKTGLERAMELVDQAGESGRSLTDRLAEDEIVKPLLVLHGLHPLNLEARVRQAVERTRPALQSRGGEVEGVVVDPGGGVHVTVRAGNGGGHGCGSPEPAIRTALEDAIYECAPDAVRVVVDVATEVPEASAFVPLSSLRRRADAQHDATHAERSVAHT